MSTARRPKASATTTRAVGTGYIDPDDPRFPTSDGKPMADSTTQFRWIVIIKEGLDALYADRDDVFVAGDLLWYVDRNDPRICTAPDVLVAFGRPRGDRRSYKQWFEETPPHVVFEVHSHTNTAKRMREKLDFYDRYGVEEYYYYDPEGAWLQGWSRGDDGRLEPIPEARLNGWRSPRLEVTFENFQIKEGLILRGPDGEPFKTFGEVVQDRKAAIRTAELEARRARRERRRANRQTQRADAESQRADQAERDRDHIARARDQAERDRDQAERDRDHIARDRDEALARAERLAARLRELGMEEP